MLNFLSFLSLFCCVWSQVTTPPPVPPPEATNYLGIGYNIYKGNPEGDFVTFGGLDPGLIEGSNIFQFTYNNDGVNPDQSEIVVLSVCNITVQQDIFWGTASYQAHLDRYIDLQGSTLTDGYHYASSVGYDEIEQTCNSQGSVYYDDRSVEYCGYGRIRTEAASAEQFPLTTSFVSSVCSLPLTYNEEVYMQYLDTWGTHVVVEVTYGSRVTKRHKDERNDFIVYATQDCPGCIFQGGPLDQYNESLIVDMDMFITNMDENTNFGSEKSVIETGGSGDMTEPTGLTLITMADALDLIYWQQFCTYVTDGQCVLDDLAAMTTRKGFLETAIMNYPSYKGIGISSDPIVQTPLTWPEGTYGLTATVEGCPFGTDFNFETGWRNQDTENSGSNQWSTPYNMMGPYSASEVTTNFCMKTTATVSLSDWAFSPGEYCIYKLGNCPGGFIPGYVFWDDEDDAPQSNALFGTLPDGTYDRNTQIFYCCRSDGDPNTPIYLPTETPFSLIKSTANNCQNVAGMTVSEEWFLYDTEDLLNEDEVMGNAPYNTGGETEHQLHYCYYS